MNHASAETPAVETDQAAHKVPEGYSRLLIGIAGLAALSYYTWDASSMPLGESSMPGPGLFPMIVGIAGILFSIIVIVDALPKIRKRSTIELPQGSTAKGIVGVLLLLAGYVLVIDLLGTYLSSAIFAVLSIKVLSHHPWWRSALYGVVMGVTCVFLFDYLLNVSLPQSSLW